MFALVALHHHAAFCFQFPGSLVHVEHYDIHAKVLCGLLCGQSGAQGVVEEDEHGCLIFAKLLVFVTVFLYFKGLVEGFSQISYI